ncbi:MAG: hypothetical protein V7632_413 [Bradyrhizobium sp.]|jgi:predicted MFS family arabinose efflux permease
MTVLAGALARALPSLQPAANVGYGALLRSFPKLLAEEPILRVRAWAAALESRIAALLVLSIGTILLDLGITTDQTLGRRAVNLPRPEARGRINGLFVALFFIGGTIGAAAAAAASSFGGWTMVCVIAGAFGVLGLITDIATKTGSS